ncbi:histidine kinase [Polyangium jinanense]|uniref:Histidine kinase n=1 Tax=Polyangium jinanense TaxID=2829994 RepID=A0A9X4AWI8_9BACT|nr:histidine kinase [Polyangium jinanense]MDC3960959.1 histidine kinase [Polyangium jinanense]MDC3987379.1 histidine kinase [Polyangium jinanense]
MPELSRGAPSVGASPLDAHFFGWKRFVATTAVVLAILFFPFTPSDRQRDNTNLPFLLVCVPALLLTLSAVFHWATRRRLGSAQTLLVSLAVASIAGIVLVMGTWAVRTLLHVPPPPGRPVTYAIAIRFGVTFGLFMCAIWALAFMYPYATEDARRRALEAEKLKLEADRLRTAGELARLRAQLEPHFLLNTLNAIAGLVTQDPGEARRLLACLGDLLRDALHDADEMQTLGEEIAWLRRYAEILESRHRGTLRFQWDIADRAAQVLMPRLLLQPLVENAVKHGALRRHGGGQVVVRATLRETGDGAPRRLVCTVEDNGPGMPAKPLRSGAFGLHAVRRRLELKYTDAGLQIDSSPDGTRCIVELPCVTTPPRPATRAIPEMA